MAKHLISIELAVAAGTAPHILLLCKSCNKGAQSWTRPVEFPWALRVRCPTCTSDWYVCTICPSSQRNRRCHTDRKAIMRHNRSHHNSTSTQSVEVSATVNIPNSNVAADNMDTFDAIVDVEDIVLTNNDNSCVTTMAITTRQQKIQAISSFWQQLYYVSLPPDFKRNLHGNANHVYFCLENNRPGLGAAGIVSNSQFESTVLASSLQPDDVWLQLAYADFVYHLTTKKNVVRIHTQPITSLLKATCPWHM